MTTNLETSITDLEPPRQQRDLVRTGIHLAVFAAWTAGAAYGTTYFLEMVPQHKVAEIAVPIAFFGSIPVLMGIQYGVQKVLERVRP